MFKVFYGVEAAAEIVERLAYIEEGTHKEFPSFAASSDTPASLTLSEDLILLSIDDSSKSVTLAAAEQLAEFVGIALQAAKLVVRYSFEEFHYLSDMRRAYFRWRSCYKQGDE